MKRVWTVNEVKENLLKSDIWLHRSILAIYNLQAESEKSTESTHLLNKVGFSAFDAKRMSYYAKWIKSDHKLSGRHRDLARAKMLRYSKQLTKIANGEII
jgi:hypothetical protein